MTQKAAQQTRLIEKRAKALTTILLTRRGDVSIQEMSEEYGLDFIVSIIHEDKPGLRQFGVKYGGVWTKATAGLANEVLYPSMQRLHRHGPFPYPVVLLVYTMENGEGWYTWVTEPHISSDGNFELRANEEAACHPLGDESFDEIIDRVDAWYDAFFARTSKEAPRRRKR